jgi:hypothetical protein
MSLQHLTLKEVDEKVLAALVANGVCESRTLEFKQDLQVATDEQKQEFLSDVTALGNTDGGDILFGMRAEKGVAKELVGLRNFVPDGRIGQLENLLRDFVQPRLPGLQIEARVLGSGNHALLVRAGRSFAAPHMVRHQGITRFCGRNSNGKYDLDALQLRSAFLASEAMSDKLRNFWLDRINKLVSGNGPVALTTEHLIVLHLLPVVSARPDLRLGTGDFQKLMDLGLPQPMIRQPMAAELTLADILSPVARVIASLPIPRDTCSSAPAKICQPVASRLTVTTGVMLVETRLPGNCQTLSGDLEPRLTWVGRGRKVTATNPPRLSLDRRTRAGALFSEEL